MQIDANLDLLSNHFLMFLCVDDSEILKNKFLILVSLFFSYFYRASYTFFKQEIAIVVPVYPLLAAH